MKLSTFFFLILFSSLTFAQTKVAVVKLLRGEVDVLTLGKTTKLKVNDWVTEGSVIRTAEKSFVKLIFTDKSQMNVGPGSEMKIETFSGKDSGVIDLVKGKIRSQVTKDYLQIKDKDKSKLFIKTTNAVMGVRGTDFMISTNGTSTSTILFEGEIVFNRLSERGSLPSSRLEEIVDRGVRVFPGEFSVMDAGRPMPTVPALLNIQQREKLENNKDFNADRTPSNSNKIETTKSVVPAGLTGDVVANNSEILKTEVAQATEVDLKKNSSPASTNPEGYVKGDAVKPANGSFVHVDSGVIIPPGPGSILDNNTNTYIPGQETGTVAGDGSYIPPKNVEITADGKILVALPDGSGNVRVQEVEKPVPIVSLINVPINQIGEVLTTNPTLINTETVVDNDILNGTFSPSGVTDLSNDQLNQTGGFTGINDPTRVSGKIDTTVIVVPPTQP